MKISRRSLLKTAGAALFGMTAPRASQAIEIPGNSRLLELHDRFTSPVKIESIEQLKVGKTIYFRVRSSDVAEGICPAMTD